VLALVAMLMPAGAAAQVLTVAVGSARVLHLRVPAHHVVIGNPKVADVALENTQTLSIFGRLDGATTLTILDGAGHRLYDARIMVVPVEPGGVEVVWGTGKGISSGGKTQPYTCAGAQCFETPDAVNGRGGH
jgi:Flp pilus assembly secretin CpaC